MVREPSEEIDNYAISQRTLTFNANGNLICMPPNCVIKTIEGFTIFLPLITG
ncbi:MAG: hypothetical protein K0B06_12600 [Brevefilum sp.]|nr:hypothetical protein [Brevefilum sp.]